MPYNASPLSRPPSRELYPLTRRISIEEAYHLADTARRKSSDKFVREDLRLKLGHNNILELLLHDIALNEKDSPAKMTQKQSPPPSPTREAAKVVPMPKQTGVDDYGFGYDDDGEEDVGGLALMRTPSRRPQR